MIDSDTLRLTFSQDVSLIDPPDDAVHDDSTGGDSGGTSHVVGEPTKIDFLAWTAGIGNGEHYTFTDASANGFCSPQTGTMHG